MTDCSRPSDGWLVAPQQAASGDGEFPAAPGLALFARLVAAAGLVVVVVDAAGRVVQPMLDSDDIRDGAARRYPSHLDVILDPLPGEWWADQYGLVRPPETFRRDRRIRDAQRRRSQWEVRVKQFRNAPEPPDPSAPGPTL